MRHCLFALVAVAPLLGSGCGFAANIRRNVVYSPLFAYTERASHHRSLQLGREAWQQMALAHSDEAFSCDYRRGFVEGFADFIDYGGSGEPPPIPQKMYLLFGYMTPEGHAAMEDYRIGWRHGAATSRASGLRELVTVPVYMGPVYASSPPQPAAKKDAVLPPPTKMGQPEDVAPAPLPNPVIPAPKAEPPKAEPPPPEPPKAEPPKPEGPAVMPPPMPPAEPEKPE